MKEKTWLKHHKYFGLVLAFFISMFCVSGLILNHPSLFSKIDISRRWLPSAYRYNNWNNGLLRGTEKWRAQVLLYGNNGVWLTDSTAKHITDFNKGFPQGVDNRNIRGLISMPGGAVFAASTYGLYRLDPQLTWKYVDIGMAENDKISDISTCGDSLIVTSRSYIFLARPPYTSFKTLVVKPAYNEPHRVSLFRTVWWLHSGQLFGLLGRLVVDAVALILLFLSISGVLYWFLPHIRKGAGTRLMPHLFLWHNKVGRLTLGLTILICVTGWLLRPPALLLIVYGKIPPVPFSTVDNDNVWYDKLRSVRYDATLNDWLLYTSDGFYSLRQLTDIPQRTAVQPPVSVMGLNVQQTTQGDFWLLGSFSGLYVWQRSSGIISDYYTFQRPQKIEGSPLGAHIIAGYSPHFIGGKFGVDYNKGAPSIPMPREMATLPMSLRQVAIELHTGRLYTFFGSGSVLYIFIIGLGILWCLWTGKKIMKK